MWEMQTFLKDKLNLGFKNYLTIFLLIMPLFTKVEEQCCLRYWFTNHRINVEKIKSEISQLSKYEVQSAEIKQHIIFPLKILHPL